MIHIPRAPKTNKERYIDLRVSSTVRDSTDRVAVVDRHGCGNPDAKVFPDLTTNDVENAQRAVRKDGAYRKFDAQHCRITCGTHLWQSNIFPNRTEKLAADQLGHLEETARLHYVDKSLRIPDHLTTLEATMKLDRHRERDHRLDRSTLRGATSHDGEGEAPGTTTRGSEAMTKPTKKHARKPKKAAPKKRPTAKVRTREDSPKEGVAESSFRRELDELRKRHRPGPEIPPLLPVGHPIRQKVESLYAEVSHAAIDGGDSRLHQLARRLRAAVEEPVKKRTIPKGQISPAARRLVRAVAYDIELYDGEPDRVAEAFVKKVSVSAFRPDVDPICSPFAALHADHLGQDPDALEGEAERYYEAVERVAAAFRKLAPDFEEGGVWYEGTLDGAEAKAATREGLKVLGMDDKFADNHFGNRLVLK